jgi:hypothetical protein
VRQSFLSGDGYMAQRNVKKVSSVSFLIPLIQMHRFILICCKIHRCLTLQRELTLAEIYNFLVVVNTGVASASATA